jgi:hypothetical protein
LPARTWASDGELRALDGPPRQPFDLPHKSPPVAVVLAETEVAVGVADEALEGQVALVQVKHQAREVMGIETHLEHFASRFAGGLELRGRGWVQLGLIGSLHRPESPLG